MNKKLLAFLLLLIGIYNLSAAPVDLSTARKAGEGFVQSHFTSESKSLELDLALYSSAYYVFNVGDVGFVIISSDDTFRPVVGYSEEGVFDSKNPSPELMYYLHSLSQGRQAALRTSTQPVAEVVSEWSALLNGKELPSRNGKKASFYLVKTVWNQDYPYNKFCPREANGARTYAGCVATAMSQVMNYWKYPTHGYGRHSYVHYQFGELAADFSSAEYDYDLMPNSIGESSPEENIDAIAMFMYHCGIAVDMGYSSDGSGAYSEDVPDAVLKYFGYTNCCRLIYRDAYPLGEFQALLKNQLDLGWPVYYSGTDTGGNGGHAFVCDGYDDNDMFHFNWGWSGSGDGFFAIDVLDVSSYAFNSGQAFTANFVPASVFANTAKAPDFLEAIPNGDDSFSVTLSWVNPTATLEGNPMETLEQIVVMRDGVVIQSFDNPVPGEMITFVDVAGLPLTVNYTVHAVYNGIPGRKASANGVNLGPACNWTVNLKAGQSNGWGDGALSFVNSSGGVLAELTANREEESFLVEVPMGRIALLWKAPTDSLTIEMEILNADGQSVFAYEGPSTLMPQGLFFETVNTCGGADTYNSPSNLKADVIEDDVVLQWKGVDNPIYGYIVYRDGYFYTMVSDMTTYTDVGAAKDVHCYFVTAFLPEGESEPSNTVSATAETEYAAPRNIDAEILSNGKVKIKWDAPEQTEQMVGYQIYRRAQGDVFKRIKNVGANVTEYTDAFRVPDGNRYYFMVVAAYEEKDYAMSAPARSLRNPDLYFVEVNRTHIPSSLTLSEQDGTLLLQWECAMLAESYNIYRNNEKIAEGVTELQYVCEAEDEPAYYQVTGVLNGVESNPSNKAYYGNYAVDDVNGSVIKLFPNPAKQFVTVQADGIRDVEVYSLTGQQLMRRVGDGDELILDLSNLEDGVYYFRINTGQGPRIQKVVLVK